MRSEVMTYSLEVCLDALIDYRGKTPRKTDSGIPLVTAKVVKNGRIETPTEFIAAEDFEAWMTRGLPQVGDVVMTTEAPLGEVGQIQRLPVALAQRIVTLRGKKGLLHNDYLLYALQSEPVQEQLRGRASGTTVVGIKQSELRKVTLGLPPYQQQVEVASVMKALDDRIDLLRQTNATLESIAQALFKSWFIDFDPVRAKQAGREPEGMDAATAALFPAGFEESALGLIPKGWHVKSIGDVATVIKGKSYKSNELLDSDTALVTLKSFERGGGFRRDGFKGYVGSYKPEQVVAPGECIVAFTDVTQNAEVIGRAALVESSKEYARLVASLDVGILRPNAAGMDASFLYFLLQDERYIAHIGGYTSGTTVLHLAKDGVPAFRFVLPPEVVLSAFADMAKFLLAKRAVNISLSEELVQLRDTLLPRLISGKLRLPEARKQLEDALA